jgi:hypothetical protein
MARGIGYEFVDNHSQSPAAIRPKQQRTGGKHQVYFQAIKLGTTDREAELAKIGRRVNYSIGFRHLQCTMDVCIRVKEFADGAQGQFYLSIVGMRSSERHRADRGGKFVVDPVIQFVQQNRLVQEPYLWFKFDSDLRLPRDVLLPACFALRPRDAQAKPGGSSTVEIRESGFSLYNAGVR